MARSSEPFRTAAFIVLALIAALLIGIGIYGVRRALSVEGSRRARVAGICLILLVVVLWTSSSVVIEFIFEEAHFRKPFFLTWYNVALLSVYLPFYPQQLRQLSRALLDKWRGVGRHSGQRSQGKYVAVGQPSDGPPRLSRESRESSYEEGAGALGGSKTTTGCPTAALGTALRLLLIFFGNQVCFNIGLELSTMSTVTVIAASSGLWTLLFSSLRLRERIGPVKLISTVLTFGGVMLVVLASGDTEYRPLHHGHHAHAGAQPASSSPAATSSSLWGNAATLLSAMLYGAYAAQLKHEVPSEDELPMPYLFGLIGLCAILVLAPLIPILHVLHIERFALPSRYTLVALTLNGLLGSVLSNMLLARAMILASPLVATVGLSLSIPLAIAADALRGRGHFAEAAPILGTAFVWCGFLGVSAAEQLESRCVAPSDSPRAEKRALPR